MTKSESNNLKPISLLSDRLPLYPPPAPPKEPVVEPTYEDAVTPDYKQSIEEIAKNVMYQHINYEQLLVEQKRGNFTKLDSVNIHDLES